MMMGALGAILFRQKNPLFLKITDNKPAQLICWIIVLLSAFNHFQIASIIDNEILSIVAVFLIIGQINTRNRIISLENNLCDFLGKISYGIYVIHPLLIFYFSKFLNLVPIEGTLKYVFVYTVIVGSTIGIAYLSYRYFETYFLKLKRKYTVVNSSATSLLKK
jgi:peptidoglycan/LPS O-acetylase OafA/YrhL